MADIDDGEMIVEEISEETVETRAEEVPEEAPEEDLEAPVKRPKSRAGFVTGLLSGAIVGGVLALLLGPLRGEPGPSGERWQSREAMEKEGAFRARVAGDRVKGVAGGVIPALKGAWDAFRGRLREAAEETKEGYAEGQAEARGRYETMTKRHRRRR